MQSVNFPALQKEFLKFLNDFSFGSFQNVINLVTWNANSIRGRLKEFKYFLYKNNYDIVGICETKTDKKFSLKLPGYQVYLNSRNSFGGGVLIAIKENIAHSFYKVALTVNI